MNAARQEIIDKLRSDLKAKQKAETDALEATILEAFGEEPKPDKRRRENKTPKSNGEKKAQDDAAAKKLEEAQQNQPDPPTETFVP